MRRLHLELAPGVAAPLASVPVLEPETFALWLAHETHEEPREGHCRECGEVLGWTYFENVGFTEEEEETR